MCFSLSLGIFFKQFSLFHRLWVGFFFSLSLSLTFFASVPRFLVFFFDATIEERTESEWVCTKQKQTAIELLPGKKIQKTEAKDNTFISSTSIYIVIPCHTHTHTHTHRQTIIDGRVQANTMDSKQEKKKQKRKKRERNKKKNTPILPMKTCEARKKEQQQQIYCGAGVGPT